LKIRIESAKLRVESMEFYHADLLIHCDVQLSKESHDPLRARDHCTATGTGGTPMEALNDAIILAMEMETL